VRALAVNVGDTIWVRVFKADGRPHRQWQARVVARSDDCIVTVVGARSPVYQYMRDPATGQYNWREFTLQRAMRSFYWPGRRHTLLEVYNADGGIHELYADICSPVQVGDEEIGFIDHELDVSQMAGEAPQLVDEDEFAEAAVEFGYSEAFQRECYDVALSLLAFVAAWVPSGWGSESSRPDEQG